MAYELKLQWNQTMLAVSQIRVRAEKIVMKTQIEHHLVIQTMKRKLLVILVQDQLRDQRHNNPQASIRKNSKHNPEHVNRAIQKKDVSMKWCQKSSNPQQQMTNSNQQEKLKLKTI